MNKITLEKKDINVGKLHMEFIESELTPVLLQHDDDNIYITFEDDVDEFMVENIVSKHNPSPLPNVPTLEDYVLNLEYELALMKLGL